MARVSNLEFPTGWSGPSFGWKHSHFSWPFILFWPTSWLTLRSFEIRPCLRLEFVFFCRKLSKNRSFSRIMTSCDWGTPTIVALCRHLGGCKILAVDNMEPLRSFLKLVPYSNCREKVKLSWFFPQNNDIQGRVGVSSAANKNRWQLWQGDTLFFCWAQEGKPWRDTPHGCGHVLAVRYRWLVCFKRNRLGGISSLIPRPLQIMRTICDNTTERNSWCPSDGYKEKASSFPKDRRSFVSQRKDM